MNLGRGATHCYTKRPKVQGGWKVVDVEEQEEEQEQEEQEEEGEEDEDDAE